MKAVIRTSIALGGCLLITLVQLPKTASFTFGTKKVYNHIQSSTTAKYRDLILSSSYLSHSRKIDHDEYDGDDVTKYHHRMENDEVELSSSLSNRRSVLLGSSSAAFASILASSSLGLPSIANAADESSIGGSNANPIAIIGAGGKCGTLCCEILKRQGLYARAVTRSGRQVLDSTSEFVNYAPGDVTNYDSIKEAVKGCSGVIFAASASGKKKGGDPEHVDYLGLYNTAKACLECNVPKLVVISAGSVTRPDFAGFKATNFFVKFVYGDNMMDAKIAGESVMRDLYASANKPNCSYCVVRPGGLSDAKVDGPTQIHVSQGDFYSAEISREDVAEISVAALANKSTDFTTFELNKVKGLTTISNKLPTPPDNLVHSEKSSYGALLDGLLTDDEMKKKYPVYLNDFRGDGMRPISAIS